MSPTPSYPPAAPAAPALPGAALPDATRPDGPRPDAAQRHADRYRGIWLPVVTPFQADGRVDHTALRALVTDAVLAGIAGFVACGSTGEAAMLATGSAPQLEDDEQAAVLGTVLAASGGRPVLMGLQGVVPAAVAARAQALADAHPGVAGWLLAPPPYVKPSQAGLIDFYTQVADASPRPIVAYDIPGRTGVRIEPATLLALADHPRIEAVKDCSGDRAAAEAVLADGRLAWLGGNDDELFDQLARGAAGAIVASAHVATAGFVALHRAIEAGDLPAARALWRRLCPLTRALFAEPNPAPIKAVLAQQGRLTELLRAPMRPASATTVRAAAAALRAVDG